MTTRYIPHIIYAVALTSSSIHLLNHRKNAAEERALLRARESVLVSIIEKLKKGDNMSDAEITRLRYLGERKEFEGMVKQELQTSGVPTTSWRDTFLGKKGSAAEDDRLAREWADCTTLSVEVI